MSSELVLGIDLGTTYSTAAAVIDGRIHYAVDGRGESVIPSVIHFPKAGPPLVGSEAGGLSSSTTGVPPLSSGPPLGGPSLGNPVGSALGGARGRLGR